jgi:catechol 2,3-dioxygenase-like lactoylglutathione lyase family enzyme
MVGINHVALEVDDLERALGFYRSVFSFELRGTAPGMAFLDMGDQFLALSEGRSQGADSDRHFGLVVDDLDATRNALERTGAEILPSRGLDFRDDSGNHIQVVAYSAIQFTKAPSVIRGMGAGELEKDESALAELREAGLG